MKKSTQYFYTIGNPKQGETYDGVCYRHPEIYVHRLEEMCFQGRGAQYSSTLFHLTFQTDSQRGHQLKNIYGGKLEVEFAMNCYFDEALKILAKLPRRHMGNFKGILKQLHKLGARRRVYSRASHLYIPTRYRRLEDLYKQMQKHNI